MKTDDITEVSLSFELYNEMKQWCSKQKLFTTSYNHGWKPFKDGQEILVDRTYTINFCFQSTTIADKHGRQNTFYKIKRGGRPTTRYGQNSSPEDKERLRSETPSYEAMIYPALTRCQSQIRKVKRGLTLEALNYPSNIAF
ncbi:hypothetical protein BBM40_18420 [Vibrio parahaemolyticus]|uniref:hypothetical protein n=1 Tax=Vibrio parahaemolyticus TaxID=670 RepID=UPI00064AD83A|nr:hypothetical protein [Vibrio parahaemolyticus]EGQ7840160.1 hypothetical protein [Vibrio parahaemolyticus]EGQ9316125.1 hypothetical protein [Vibrio parahaemolyticus]EHH1033072.1 hypothetical protein [Vibrio parahaemolyticus]EHH2502544.1 hypothetical protein [Vibrio parahaemolyticus]EJG1474400.1 hypothetical protein [Vibrio parahaemolyticus]